MGVFDETGVYVEDLYYTHDALKNTTALFGIKAGRRALYEYGPYGSAVKMEGNAAELNPFRFSSEYADDELGLVYYNYRYYNPQNGRWISRDPMTEKESCLLYGYVNNMPTLYSDELGLACTITTNKDDCSINVSLNIVIYPKGGDSINNIEMRTTAQRIKQSIESNWNGYEKGCCVVNVTADVSVQSRKSRWLYRFLNSDENDIEITSDSSHRSYVNGVGGRYGVWGSQAVPWVYAHEAGHLMGLSDDYQDVANSDGSLTSVPNAGHEGHIMGEYGGKANQHEIDAIKKISNVHAMKINKCISIFFIILFSILLIDCAISEENKNQHMEPDRIILRDLTKNLQVIVTFGHSSRGTQEIILKKNQHIKFFGIDFALRKGILYAKRDKEEKVFLSPGSYYINISPIKGTWVSGKTFIPFEGKYHPKQ